MGRKDIVRIETGPASDPLKHSPFAALQTGSAPQPTVPPAEPPASPEVEPASFRVARTRKGGLPIFVENRPKGKVATVIRNVSGDADALLSILKKRCGAGGLVRDDTVEIQGDHRDTVEGFLKQSGALRL